ncbi:lysophospholipid acyltransferase family protein [Legionella jordanis]|uniref:Lipid A biosynthesis acyltransferase n=1 Tax=Legionella jordanis TaxID=456 RepID=A0A0W0VBX9_9GAMM|nr:lipid A biosynthesis acyltransferase [Legionella jordanis]VEH11468.1 lipid A biosynthesis lauroyl acyltransferase [Legionella jordanis]
MGRFLYHFLPYRRSIVQANINLVFGHQLNAAQKKRLAKAFYSHMAMSIKEIVQLRFMSEKKLKERVDVKGYQRLLDIVAQNRGVLILTGHFGNWEFAPLGGILNFEEFKGQFHFIRRTLGSKALERLLFRRYYQAGLNVIPKKNSLDQVCNALDQNHAVVFVLDQHASLANRDGVAVEFFGKKAGTYRSLATLARHTGVPVVPAAGYRLPNGRHVLEFHDPIYWQDYPTIQESIYQNTLAYNQALERIILAHPEQWHWLHKRWKLKNVDNEPSN